MATRILALCFIALSVMSSLLYREHYRSEKKKATEAMALAAQRQQAINALQRQQHAMTELDAKYTQELANAHTTIEQLKLAVAAGCQRLQLGATCERVPSSAPSTSMANAASAGLTDAAERDYSTLRERIALADRQIAGFAGLYSLGAVAISAVWAMII